MNSWELDQIKRDFDALVTTIQSIYDLRGIGVSAAYISKQMMDWMRQCYGLKENMFWVVKSQMFDEAEVVFKEKPKGGESVSFKPFGADRIPVKVKYSGKNPWKIVVAYHDA